MFYFFLKLLIHLKSEVDTVSGIGIGYRLVSGFFWYR